MKFFFEFKIFFIQIWKDQAYFRVLAYNFSHSVSQIYDLKGLADLYGNDLVMYNDESRQFLKGDGSTRSSMLFKCESSVVKELTVQNSSNWSGQDNWFFK